MFSKGLKIVLFAALAFALTGQRVMERVVARTDEFPVTLLEVVWAKKAGLLPQRISLREAAERIALARIVYRRYGRVIPDEEYKKQYAHRYKGALAKAREAGIPEDTISELAEKLLNLEYFVKQKFSSNRRLYLRWKEEVLRDEGFSFIG